MLDQDKSIVLDLNTGRYYSLNRTGTIVWQRLNRNQPVDAIADHLTAPGAASHESVTEDVTAFVNFLAERGLIVESVDLAACPSTEPLPTVASADYVKPLVDEHEALQRVVAAGSDDSSSYSSGGYHYWYPC